MRMFKDVLIVIFVLAVFSVGVYFLPKYLSKPKPIPSIEHVSTKMDSAFFAYKNTRFNDSLKLALLEKRLDSLQNVQVSTSNLLDSLNKAKRKSPNKLPLISKAK